MKSMDTSERITTDLGKSRCVASCPDGAAHRATTPFLYQHEVYHTQPVEMRLLQPLSLSISQCRAADRGRSFGNGDGSPPPASRATSSRATSLMRARPRQAGGSPPQRAFARSAGVAHRATVTLDRRFGMPSDC
jgi:hypothetical protein